MLRSSMISRNSPVTMGKTSLVYSKSYLLGEGFLQLRGINYYRLTLVDFYIMSYGLTVVGLFTCILIGWVYGADKIREYINEVSEVYVGVWFDICIKFITPVILTVLLVLNIYENVISPYEGYPGWMQLVGGVVLMAAILIFGFVFMKARTRDEEEAEKGEVS